MSAPGSDAAPPPGGPDAAQPPGDLDGAPQPGGPDPAPDPMKGLAAVFAAVLTLESIAVLLGLLLPDLPSGHFATITGLGGLLLVGAGLQRRPWGRGLAIGLQVLTIAAGLLEPAVGVVGVIFALVVAFLLRLRRLVAQKMARGELPAQREA